MRSGPFWHKIQWLLRLVAHDQENRSEIIHVETQRTLGIALGLEDYESLTHMRERVSSAVADAFQNHILDRLV